MEKSLTSSNLSRRCRASVLVSIGWLNDLCNSNLINEQYFDMIPNPATCPCCRGLQQVRGNRRKWCDQMTAAWHVISHRKWPLYSLQNWGKRCETPKSRTSSARTLLCWHWNIRCSEAFYESPKGSKESFFRQWSEVQNCENIALEYVEVAVRSRTCWSL